VTGARERSLYYFQGYRLFDPEQLDAVLNRPEWKEKYPELMRAFAEGDARARGPLLLPPEIVLTVARECRCSGDLYAEADGETLQMTAPGAKPFRLRTGAGGKLVMQVLRDAKLLSAERAILEYGADAVCLAEEYGSSRRGERDERFP
jgi:hypothetical protein